MAVNYIDTQLANIRVVLSHPRDPRNVGAACRAMKTMGLGRLYVVGGPDLNTPESRRLAVHAEDVLDSVCRVDTLGKAVDGCSLIAGTTRRQGQRRKQTYLSPAEMAARLRTVKSECAIVFGNEASGLSDDELEACHTAVTIPSSPACPSLNLSHAVQVICYEIRAGLAEGAPDNRRTIIDERTLTSLVADIMTSLHAMGYLTQPGPQGMEVFLRDILARAALTGPEARRFESLFTKLAGMSSSS